jgi:hypothetical protein
MSEIAIPLCKCGQKKTPHSIGCKDCYSRRALETSGMRKYVPINQLQIACERLQAGERWDDVLIGLGVGRTALRGCLKRAGLPYHFGRLGHKYARKTKTQKMDYSRTWAESL